MILYIESKAFPHRTFVVRLQPFETVARIRAQMLHILYELGRDNHQFRLRYKGQYLRDAYTLEDYGIISNSIIKMIPLSKHSNSVVDLRSLEEERSTPPVLGQEQDVKDALLKEIAVFNQRERLIYDFRGLLYLHFMAIWLSFLTSYWWSGFWTAAVFLFGVYYCPTFTRMGGFIGKHSIYKFHFCIIYGIASLVNMGASVYLGTREWVRVINHGCKDWVFVDDCSHQVIYSGLFFCIQALCLAISSIIAWVLLWNMKVEYGDYVERHLVQTRDIEEVMKAAKSGRTKEKRVAAFELATLAASGDDNKFRIVAEGGLDVLIRMVLGRDESTQEHAMEALAELLTVPSIQDTFVEMGGMRTLTAVMHASSQRLIYEAAMAISYVVSDSEENKTAVTANHGLDDLCYAAQHAGAATKRVIAGTFLELAFNEEIRAQMTARDTTAKALVQLCLSADPDTQRYALQTLELLAIESADMICAQEELLDLLLELPSRTSDQDVHLLACKILLYYAESPQTCETLLFKAGVREALTKYSHGRDPMLQKVVIKVIYCAAEDKLLRAKADELQLTQVLKYIRTHAADREVWDMADQAIQTFESDENLTSLPPLSAAEKIQRMDSKNKAVLELVCDPVRRYLRCRDDTVRCIVSSLTEDGGNELSDELIKAQPLKMDDSCHSDDDMEDWESWMPDPVDADPGKVSRRSSDIISMLVNIYGSKELFVNEYRTLLADRILSQFNYDTEKEIRYLELLKLRFGESQLHYCEVMLKDVADSRRINQHISEQRKKEEQTQEEISVNAMILSAQFWPTFREEKLDLPPQLQEALETYTKSYETLKGNRTLNWKPHLGLVDIEIELKDKTLTFNVSPIHATIIMHFQEKGKWTVEELSSVMHMPTAAIRRKITFWQSQGLLREESTDTFLLVEEQKGKGQGQEVIMMEEEDTESAMASQEDQREEELQVFWSYIVGMLTNLESLPLERIHSILKMFAMQGPSTGEVSLQELKVFLDRKVKEQKLLYAGGVYRLPKTGT